MLRAAVVLLGGCLACAPPIYHPGLTPQPWPGDAGGDAGDSSTPAITVSLVPSRTSGVAPLAVFFDASGTTAVATERPFQELVYRWTFGDNGAVAWATTGRSKNTATGPVAGHVFETAGERTVTLTVTDHLGHAEQAQVTITVDDPEAVFATSTICVSQDGTFTGCPSADRRTLDATGLKALVDATAGPRRILLNRGETWALPDWIYLEAPGPGILGAFGSSGAKPVLQRLASPVLLLSAGGGALDDWRFVDLAMTCSAVDPGELVRSNGHFSEVTFLRVDFVNVPRAYLVQTESIDPESFPLFDGLAIVDGTLTQPAGSFRIGMDLAADRLMVMGNTIRDASVGAQVCGTAGRTGIQVRLSDRAVVAHNDVQSHQRPLIVNAKEFADAGAGQYRVTGRVEVSDNLLAAACLAVVIGPVSSANDQDQRVRDVILERNRLQSGGLDGHGIRLCGQDLVVRNNLVEVVAAGYSVPCVALSQRGVVGTTPSPDRADVVNNTCYSADATELYLVDVTDSEGSRVVNNLLWGSDVTTRGVQRGTAAVAQSSNLLPAATPFEVMAPSSPLEFGLPAASPAVDAGELFPGVGDDYLGAPRPKDGDGVAPSQNDIGALERQGNGD
jgi:PKD repeat protein